MQSASAAKCTRECVKSGSDYTLIVGDKVYTLKGDKAAFNKFAGSNVVVKGKAIGSTLTVEGRDVKLCFSMEVRMTDPFTTISANPVSVQSRGVPPSQTQDIRRLQFFTIGWMVLECLISLVSAKAACSPLAFDDLRMQRILIQDAIGRLHTRRSEFERNLVDGLADIMPRLRGWRCARSLL